MLIAVLHEYWWILSHPCFFQFLHVKVIIVITDNAVRTQMVLHIVIVMTVTSDWTVIVSKWLNQAKRQITAGKIFDITCLKFRKVCCISLCQSLYHSFYTERRSSHHGWRTTHPWYTVKTYLFDLWSSQRYDISVLIIN